MTMCSRGQMHRHSEIIVDDALLRTKRGCVALSP
jgi:hypothetical protein